MTYLAQYVARHPALGRRARRGARVDERTRLNLPGFYGDAFVRVFDNIVPGIRQSVHLGGGKDFQKPREKLRRKAPVAHAPN